MEPLLSGCYTAEDNMLYELLYMLADFENKYLEPSALAGMFGPVQLFTTEEGKRYLQDNQLQSKMKNAVHIIWGTGRSMVPRGEMETYHRIGSALINSKK
ncbi:hypothetical protein RA13_10450 [Bacillus atrophaeus]|nr:hypothetical protein RA13_10450 [Bacillus atrophaeus]